MFINIIDIKCIDRRRSGWPITDRYIYTPSTSASCTFTIFNDDIPESNETFVVQLTLSGSGSTVVSPSVAYLMILANDDAFGIIGFNEVRKVGY